MKTGSANLISLHRILERKRFWEFLAETAVFYESRLILVDEAGRRIRDTGRTDPVEGAGTAIERRVEVFGQEVGSVLTTPCKSEDRSAAVALADHVARLLSDFAEREYELDDLSREILDSYEEVNLFYDMASALSAVHDVEGVCSVILAKACEIVKVNRASILLPDDAGRELFLAAAIGIPEEEWDSVRIPIGRGISGRVLDTRVAQLVDDVRNLPRGLLTGYETYATRSFISVPLCVSTCGGRPVKVIPGWPETGCLGPDEGRAIGVINMTDKRDGENFTSGDLKLLAALASQAAVLIQNMRLVDFEKEMRIARRIQRSLLPVARPRLRGFDVAGALVPAASLGGDYYDLLCLDGGRVLAAIVADVSGHSVASALHMAVVRALLRSSLASARRPGEVLGRLNRQMYEDLTRAELFVSLFCCFVDVGTGEIVVANAGHPAGVILRRGAPAAESADAEGILLGILPDTKYEERTLYLGKGDTLLLYTDGVVEAGDESGRRFGVDRLFRSLTMASRRSATQGVDAILGEARAFSGRRGLRDDMTVVILKRTGAPGR
ncbi:MAG: SpoIIE family protein phosphatase [Planctomycetes bacterium]|jgi:sigma-B regulation protein RsbU (phosphoserine phosphatase)|nr:SpoIIE family protein phosphatase [Planctomycetota bacterium]